MKVVEQFVGFNFAFGPKVYFGPSQAQKCFPRRPHRCLPRTRGNAQKGDAFPVHGGHARAERPTFLPCAPAPPERMSSSSTPPCPRSVLLGARSSLSLALPCLYRAHIAMAAPSLALQHRVRPLTLAFVQVEARPSSPTSTAHVCRPLSPLRMAAA